MATIKARKQANGEMRYTAIVRVRSGQTVLHSESKTFGYRTAASTWAKRRDVALEDPVELQRAQDAADSAEGYKLAKLIRWYIDTFESLSKWQRSKQTHLEFLERHAIGAMDARKMTTQGLIQHVQTRRADGAGPATACNDLTWIGVVLRAAKNVKAMPVRPEIVQEARSACRELRLIAKARRRDRRPTAEEMRRLDEYFARRDRRSRLPMRDIWHFAIESTRREAEICRAERDFHGEKRTNDTHASTTDPQCRLYKSARGSPSKLCYLGHAVSENRHGLIVDAIVTEANGAAERAPPCRCSRLCRESGIVRSVPTRHTTRAGSLQACARST